MTVSNTEQKDTDHGNAKIVRKEHSDVMKNEVSLHFSLSRTIDANF